MKVAVCINNLDAFDVFDVVPIKLGTQECAFDVFHVFTSSPAKKIRKNIFCRTNGKIAAVGQKSVGEKRPHNGSAVA